jgi:type VI secretion system protein ImpK
MTMSTTQRRRSRFAGKPKVAQATQEPQELSLRMLYAPILAYVVLFQRLETKDEIGMEDLRRQIRTMLDEASQKATAIGITQEQVAHVRFSIIAFVDEIVLTSDWTHVAAWRSQTLQFEEFGINDAGDAFFDRYEQGQPVEPEVAEIDFLIVSLGFKGRFAGLEQELLRFRSELFKRFPGIETGFTELTPEAYAYEAIGLEEVEDPWPRRSWMILGGVAVLLVAVYVILWFSISGELSEYQFHLQQLGD